MKPLLMITIDPGRSGGIAAQYPDGRTIAWPMPAEDAEVLDLLREIIIGARTEGWDIQTVIEKVGGYVGGKGQPGSAMFTFGASYGFLIGALMALEVPLVLVRPQQWQSALQLGKSTNHASKPAWKRHLRAEAARRYPQLRPTLATADALLMLAAAQNFLALTPASRGADPVCKPLTSNATAKKNERNENNMKLDELYPSRWLKAADVTKPVLATIKNVAIEEVSEGEEKPVLNFLGEIKSMVLNRTNSASIAALYGDDTDLWTGKHLVLFSTKVQFQSKLVDAIRIREPRQQAPIPKTGTPKPAPAEVSLGGAANPDDDVPF